MLQQNDIDALLASLLAAQETEHGQLERSFSELRIYDFAMPDNLPSELLRAMENINASFARGFAGMLSGLLSSPVQIDLLSIDQMTYRQFCNSVPDITAVGIFTLTPLEGHGLMEINPHLAWYLLERTLGGEGEVIDTPREFTQLERSLLEDLFRRALNELGRAWENLLPLRPAMREVLNSPTVARVAAPDDLIVVSSFGINLGAVSGMCMYCLPAVSLDIERILHSEDNWDATHYSREAESDLIAENLHVVPVPVRACLHRIQLTIGELSTLQVGDTIRLDTLVDAPIDVRIGEQRRFAGTAVTVNDKVAVEILGDLMENDDE